MRNKINWSAVKNGVPTFDGEVLAVGYQNIMMVGSLYSDEDSDTGWSCEDDTGAVLEDVTYYISVKDLKSTLPKS